MSPGRRTRHGAGGVVGWVAGILAVAALVFVLWLIFAPDAPPSEEPVGSETPPAQEDARGSSEDDGRDDLEDAANDNGEADAGEDGAVSQDERIEAEIQSAEDANLDVQTEPDTRDAGDSGLQDDAQASEGDSTAAPDASIRVWDGADAMQSSTSELTERIRQLEQQGVQDAETPSTVNSEGDADDTP